LAQASNLSSIRPLVHGYVFPFPSELCAKETRLSGKHVCSSDITHLDRLDVRDPSDFSRKDHSPNISRFMCVVHRVIYIIKRYVSVTTHHVHDRRWSTMGHKMSTIKRFLHLIIPIKITMMHFGMIGQIVYTLQSVNGNIHIVAELTLGGFGSHLVSYCTGVQCWTRGATMAEGTRSGKTHC
jgi:hypothetical protein